MYLFALLAPLDLALERHELLAAGEREAPNASQVLHDLGVALLALVLEEP